MISSEESGDLFDGLCAGDPQAAKALWDEYYKRLVSLARRALGNFPRRAFDEEDVALSAMHSFLKEAKDGRLYRWKDSREVWALLRTIARRKAFAQKNHELRQKRGNGKVRGESAFGQIDGSPSTAAGIQRVSDAGPTPSQRIALAEKADQLLDVLEDESLRQVARLRLAGHNTQEIANMFGCCRRTVERQFERIRKRWRDRPRKEAS